uniref:TIR domain-containing protein n=1 Tax=Palpitomonas bilix TaxID=652834 RepID=A0A7S3G3Z2_9EUKA
MKEREERRDLPAFPFSEADFEHGDVKQEWIRKELARIVSSCTDFDPTKRPHALTLLNQVEKLLNAFHLCLEKLEKLDSLCSDVLYESSTRKTGEMSGRVTADNFNFERPYVFLSYKTEQYEMVRRVAVILRQRCNVQVWLDRERLVAGESWASQIGLGLRKATCILGFWSNMWMRSSNCRAEWNTFVYRVNSPEDSVSRQDCFACVAGEWDYQLDDEMRVLSWGGTIQYRDLAAVDGPEWERAVINLGTAIRARFDHPED